MKKILFITALLTSLLTLAQEFREDEKVLIKKGTKNLGGSLNFFSNSSDFSRTAITSESKNNFLNLRPRVGYFIADNLELGLGFQYFRGTGNDVTRDTLSVSERNNSSHSIAILPYLRAYKPLTNKLLLYAHAELRYAANWFEDDNNFSIIPSRSGQEFGVAIRPGITYFLSKKLALEASLGRLEYTHIIGESEFVNRNDNLNETAKTTENSFRLSLNASDIFFGLSYYF